MNRNKLIVLFIGNISNTVVHKILEKAIDDDNIRKHYDKELMVSFDIAKMYREKINPIGIPLPEKDAKEIKQNVAKMVNSELKLRISKGYKNIDLSLIEPTIDEFLRKLKVI